MAENLDICTAIRPALDRKLAELSEELGIQVIASKASYAFDGATGGLKIELATVNDSGIIEMKKRRDFITFH